MRIFWRLRHYLANSTTFHELALRFPGLSRTKLIFQDFSGPGKITNAIPGISRRRGNPDHHILLTGCHTSIYVVVNRSTQPCIPLGSLNQAPALLGWRRECHHCRVAGNTVWSHVSSRSGAATYLQTCCISLQRVKQEKMSNVHPYLFPQSPILSTSPSLPASFIPLSRNPLSHHC